MRSSFLVGSFDESEPGRDRCCAGREIDRFAVEDLDRRTGNGGDDRQYAK